MGIKLLCASGAQTRFYATKMAVTSREISSVITSAANNYNTRLDSSVRIKSCICTGVT